MRSSATNLLHGIQCMFQHRPIAANSILCGTLWICGDGLAQWSEKKLLLDVDCEKKDAAATMTTKPGPSSTKGEKTWFLSDFDMIRTGQCATYGAFVTGPLIAIWYPFLHRLTQRSNPLSRYSVWGGPIFKVFVDEFVMDPPQLVIFYGYMNICEGGTVETFQHKLRDEFMTSWLTSLAVWPVVLLGTFRYVPIYAQAPLINFCAIVWDGFLSHRNASSRLKETKANQLFENSSMEETKPSNHNSSGDFNHNLSTS
jgi:hypothetical protein